MLWNKYIIISVIVAFILFFLCILNGIFIGLPLALCFVNFVVIAWKKGYLMKDIVQMSIDGGKNSFIVLKVLTLVGAITSIWMASGTTPAILYYGIRLIDPELFIIYAFVISSLVSFMLGTAFGTVSTVGLSLILMAKSDNIDVDIVAGAIIAGAYFGDRCSPMSSSAHLIAQLTNTNIYLNIKTMLKTGAFPFLLSVFLYLIISLQHPLGLFGNTMSDEILDVFSLNWVVFLPAIAIIILAVLRIDVKISMLVSIFLATVISFSHQHYEILEIFRIILLGFSLDMESSLETILKGGGIISMWKVFIVVYISCCWAGLFAKTNILADLEEILLKAKSRSTTLLMTTVVSIVTAILGCSQTIAIVFTHALMNKVYDNNKLGKYPLAIDLENTSVPLAALIPWNTAAFVLSSTMDVSLTGFIPFAFYLYLLPITNILLIMIMARFPKKTSLTL